MTTPSGRISNEPEEREKERKRERKRKNAIFSGHLCLCQQPRAAHLLRSDQNNIQCTQSFLNLTGWPNLVTFQTETGEIFICHLKIRHDKRHEVSLSQFSRFKIFHKKAYFQKVKMIIKVVYCGISPMNSFSVQVFIFTNLSRLSLNLCAIFNCSITFQLQILSYFSS